MFGVVLCCNLASNYMFAIFNVPLGCCNCLYNALSTTLFDNVEVALSVCGGVVRFLGELQKTCAACVVLFQWITQDQLQHLCLDVVSRLQLVHHLGQ
jgi:hypothetical protein